MSSFSREGAFFNDWGPLCSLLQRFDLGSSCFILHYFGAVLPRSAMIGGHFATFCNALKSLYDLHSATIWGRCASFCNVLVPFCSILH